MVVTMKFKLCSHGVSDMGLVRTNNEDAWVSSTRERLFILADGLGGHQAGEVAAKEAVDSFSKSFHESFIEAAKAELSEVEIIEALRLCFERANAHVYEMSCSHELLRGMGTTFCALSFHEDMAAISHVGDSRIYLLRNGQFEQLTKDHCWTRRHIPDGPEKLCKGVLTRALGTTSDVEPTIRLIKVCPQDLFLLCSDGLSDMLSHQEIEKVVTQPMTIGQRVRMLVSEAKKKGGGDNITVVLVEVQA